MQPTHPIEPLIAARASSRAFAPDPIDASLRSLFEAARWAASSRNEQPWRFVVTRRERESEAFARLRACLTEKNQRWAGAAPVLVATLARRRFRRDGTENRHALHDLGAATAQLMLEATARGLAVRAMAGFDAARARAELAVPDDYEVVTVLAIGRPAPDERPSEDRSPHTPRSRKPQRELVFAGAFGAPLVTDHDHEAVLFTWFGRLLDGRADAEHRAQWFRKDPAFDAWLKRELGQEHAAVVAGEREDWRNTSRGRLAYIIVLDQFSRNLFRDTPAMYAHDARALEVAAEAIAAGDEDVLGSDERAFLYMPFMHSEELADQERCIALFTTLRDALDGEARRDIEQNLHFAILHRDIVARFGRFPHRNQLLGRDSTPEEVAFLKEPGSSF